MEIQFRHGSEIHRHEPSRGPAAEWSRILRDFGISVVGPGACCCSRGIDRQREKVAKSRTARTCLRKITGTLPVAMELGWQRGCDRVALHRPNGVCATAARTTRRV